MAKSISRRSQSCALEWKNPSRTCGCNWDLLRVKEGKDRWEPGSRERAVFLQVLLKPALNDGKGRSR
jgi:hypothetical protein